MNPLEAFYFVYGPPGAGKSTLGRRLAECLRLPFYDLDERIAAQAGQTIPAIFAAEGEAGFRRRERQALQETLERPPGVAALGGGALLDDLLREQVEAAGRVLCLSAPSAVLLDRLQADAALADARLRPLLAAGRAAPSAEALEALLQLRRAHYASFPIQQEAILPPEALVEQAQVRLGAFYLGGMGAGYPLRVWPGALDELGAALQRLGVGGPLALVTDEQVGALYADRALRSLRGAGFAAECVSLPVGEEHKTIETATGLWEAFVRLGLDRHATVIALGGGVVGDIAGFAAATYLRGVAWVNLPTSLLAMVDAGLGGKTGVDLPQGKNLVGAFHPPAAVLIDPDLLGTLPPAEIRNGLAEVVKHAVLADPGLFALCRAGLEAVQADWPGVVSRALAVKRRLIEQDPYEKGPRALLNLGHTLGHALEQASGYRIPHGQAVAIGLVGETRLAERLGIAEAGLAGEIEAVLRGLGLPAAIPPELEPGRILEAMQQDKKRRGGQVRFVLPERIGAARWGVAVENLGMAFFEGVRR